jgi:hypothetical protein
MLEEKEILNSILGNTVGFFLEIGAGDGKTNSLTGDLAAKGWYATLVEPSCYKVEKLQEIYGNEKHQVFNFALSPTSESYFRDTSNEGLPDKVLELFELKKAKEEFIPLFLYYNTPTLLSRISVIHTFDLIVINIKNPGFILKGLISMVNKAKFVCLKKPDDFYSLKEIGNILEKHTLVDETGTYLFYQRS